MDIVKITIAQQKMTLLCGPVSAFQVFKEIEQVSKNNMQGLSTI